MGFQMEVDAIRMAREMDLLTTPYAFNVEEAKAMTESGVDILVCHMGLTTSGSIGAMSEKSIEDCVESIQKMRDAAIAVNEEVIVLCHGGPIATPNDADFVLRRVKGLHGFYGTPSVERLPVEEAITNITRELKGLKPGEV